MTSQAATADDATISGTKSSAGPEFQKEICITDNARVVTEEAEVQQSKLGIEPYQFEPEYSSDEDLAVDREIQHDDATVHTVCKIWICS